MSEQTYAARLIEVDRVRQVIEFSAPDPTSAWVEANDGIDPLYGQWIEVQRKPNSQLELPLT